MLHRVTLFPPWPTHPYLANLAAALGEEGWQCELVGRMGLFKALVLAILGQGTVHLHWYEGLTLGRNRTAGLVAWAFLPVMWLAGRRGRLIWTVHNLVPHEGYARFAGPAFVWRLARASGRILVHFEEHKQLVEDRFDVHGRVFVTPPADYGHVHGPPIDRATARARAFAAPDPNAMLFVQIGNLRRYRQPTTTIVAFREAAPPTARLLVAGACPDQSLELEILRAVGGDPRVAVRFDRLSDEELVAALCAADWVILPYVSIFFPSAVSLVVAYGRPLIAPAFPGVRALLAGQPAILYPTDGPSRPRLEDAIATAATGMAPRPLAGEPRRAVSWRDQARETAGIYLAARAR